MVALVGVVGVVGVVRLFAEEVGLAEPVALHQRFKVRTKLWFYRQFYLWQPT